MTKDLPLLGFYYDQLSLLLKNDPLVTSLRLFDVRLAAGVAADISHVNTPAVVSVGSSIVLLIILSVILLTRFPISLDQTTGYSPDGPEGGLEKALEGADIIVIPAGVPRKPGMTRDDLFNVSR